jgi:hypothetical protein
MEMMIEVEERGGGKITGTMVSIRRLLVKAGVRTPENTAFTCSSKNSLRH